MHPQRAHFFSAASAPTPLRLDGVSFRYDSRPEQPVLTDVSLTVPPGRTVGLIGENGSGKSTALRLLSGAALPDHGIVEAPESLGVLQQMPAAAGACRDRRRPAPAGRRAPARPRAPDRSPGRPDGRGATARCPLLPGAAMGRCPGRSTAPQPVEPGSQGRDRAGRAGPGRTAPQSPPAGALRRPTATARPGRRAAAHPPCAAARRADEPPRRRSRGLPRGRAALLARTGADGQPRSVAAGCHRRCCGRPRSRPGPGRARGRAHGDAVQRRVLELSRAARAAAQRLGGPLAGAGAAAAALGGRGPARARRRPSPLDRQV
ncbi:MAG: hypothetical protein DI634_07405 [Kocuria palustris]|nr:MAG: hypothetical protein DI634_07405 [Kocuria palustris]